MTTSHSPRAAIARTMQTHESVDPQVDLVRVVVNAVAVVRSNAEVASHAPNGAPNPPTMVKVEASHARVVSPAVAPTLLPPPSTSIEMTSPNTAEVSGISARVRKRPKACLGAFAGGRP